jgi:hypothetical protein
MRTPSPELASPANTETHLLPMHKYSPLRAASNQNWASSALVQGGWDPRVTFTSVSVGKTRKKSVLYVRAAWGRMPPEGSPNQVVLSCLCMWLEGAPGILGRPCHIAGGKGETG